MHELSGPSVRSQVSPFDREVVQRADGMGEKKRQRNADDSKTTPRLYSVVEIKACVCARWGGVTPTYVLSINYCVTLRAAQVSLHLQQHH